MLQDADPWSDYKEGLSKRLDACKATAVWSGFMLAVAQLNPSVGDLRLLCFAVLSLAVSILLAIYLTLSSGRHLSAMSGFEKTPEASFLHRLHTGFFHRILLLPMEIDDLRNSLAYRRERCARSLNMLAVTLGTLVYVLAGLGTWLLASALGWTRHVGF